MAFTPVVFNAGEPLDPNKLMDLQTNITSMQEQIAGLQNSTQAETYVTLVDFGSVNDIKIPKDTLSQGISLTTNANLESYGTVTFVVSVASIVAADENITATVRTSNGGQNPTLYVRSNKDHSVTPIKINWIAAVKKTITG